MTSMKIRCLMIVTLLSALAALPMAANSAIVSNPISTSGGSVIGGGDWATGVSVGWSVTDAGSAYLYSYTFEAPSPGLSHFDLQVSGNFSESNILDTSNSYELGTFSTGPSNPGWPDGESLHGIKFEGFTEGTSWTFTLLSDRAPMEGDFYAKGGEGSFAYNSGFGALDGANLLVPDTVSQLLPEPGTMLLLSSGLLGIAVWERRRRRMQN
jgi:hypothetical protein